MTPEEWAKIRFFKSSEFDSPDEPGSGERMQRDFMWRLDDIRKLVDVPLIISSGIRSEAHNKEVGGVDGSSHVDGWAADIVCRSSSLRWKIINQAIYIVADPIIRRIGIGKTFIHLDADPSKPQGVIWLY